MDTFGLVESLSSRSNAPRLRQGRIVATGTNTVSVNIAGDSTQVDGVTYLSGYTPTVGDTVWLMTDGADVFVLGALSPYGGSTTPIGTILAFAGSVAPAGFALCYGQTLNTYTYRALHSVISNAWGGTAYTAGVTDQVGAVTTFTLPDLRGRVIAGKDNMGGTSAARLSGVITSTTVGTAGVGGDQYLQSHVHTMNQTTTLPLNGAGNNVPVGPNSNIVGGNATTLGAGGGNSQNVQPTLILNYIIRA